MNESDGLQLIIKPTVAVAASNKADTLTAQELTIASASIGGAAFRTAATLLVTIPEVNKYKN